MADPPIYDSVLFSIFYLFSPPLSTLIRETGKEIFKEDGKIRKLQKNRTNSFK